MAKKTIKKRAPGRRRRNPGSWIFAGLLLCAILVALLLEYIDFRQGRSSFIFQKVLGLKAFSGQEVNRGLIRLFEKHDVTYSFFRDDRGSYHYRLVMEQKGLKGFRSDLEKIASAFGGKLLLKEKENFRDEDLLLLEIDFARENSFVLLLHVRLPAKKKPQREKQAVTGKPQEKKQQAPARVPGTVPRVAILIDDLGYSPLVTARLRDLQIPVSVAVIPGTPYSVQEAENARGYGFEILLHLPMQASNGNGYDGKLSFIRSDSSEGEIAALIRKARREIPHASGVNNHTGSLVTGDRAVMERVMKVLKLENLFFIDSRTSSRSLGFDVARSFSIPAYRRDVFLDGTPTYANSIRELTRLIQIAVRDGKALAIGHPFESTINALRDVIPLYKQKVRFVYVSNLLE